MKNDGRERAFLYPPRFALDAAELLRLALRLGADLPDRVRVESEFREQFVWGGNVDVVVVLVHGQASYRVVAGGGTGRPSPSPLPGLCPAPRFALTLGRRSSPGGEHSQTMSGLAPDAGFVSDGGMDDRNGWLGFWAPALLWLPAGILAGEILRTGSAEGVMTPSSLVELPAVAPFGLPLALACRRMGRLGYPGPALVAWLALGAAAAAGLLGLFDIGVQAILVSLPVWLAAWRLARLPRGLESAPSSRRPGRGRSRGPFGDGR